MDSKTSYIRPALAGASRHGGPDVAPDDVLAGLTPWLADWLGGLSAAPSETQDALVAALPRAARDELWSYGAIEPKPSSNFDPGARLTPVGRDLVDQARERPTSDEYRDKVESARQSLGRKTRELASEGVRPVRPATGEDG